MISNCIFFAIALAVAIGVFIAIREPIVATLNILTGNHMDKFSTGSPVKFSIDPKLHNGTSVSVADGLTEVVWAGDGAVSLAVAADNASCVATPEGAGVVTVTVTAKNKLGATLSDSVSVEFVDAVESLNLSAVAA